MCCGIGSECVPRQQITAVELLWWYVTWFAVYLQLETAAWHLFCRELLRLSLASSLLSFLSPSLRPFLFIGSESPPHPITDTFLLKSCPIISFPLCLGHPPLILSGLNTEWHSMILLLVSRCPVRICKHINFSFISVMSTSVFSGGDSNCVFVMERGKEKNCTKMKTRHVVGSGKCDVMFQGFPVRLTGFGKSSAGVKLGSAVITWRKIWFGCSGRCKRGIKASFFGWTVFLVISQRKPIQSNKACEKLKLY